MLPDNVQGGQKGHLQAHNLTAMQLNNAIAVSRLGGNLQDAINLAVSEGRSAVVIDQDVDTGPVTWARGINLIGFPPYPTITYTGAAGGTLLTVPTAGSNLAYHCLTGLILDGNGLADHLIVYPDWPDHLDMFCDLSHFQLANSVDAAVVVPGGITNWHAWNFRIDTCDWGFYVAPRATSFSISQFTWDSGVGNPGGFLWLDGSSAPADTWFFGEIRNGSLENNSTPSVSVFRCDVNPALDGQIKLTFTSVESLTNAETAETVFINSLDPADADIDYRMTTHSGQKLA